MVISRQHFGNYNKSEFTEFLGILHIHHKVHDANLLTNLKINKILKELETLTHTCVHTNNTLSQLYIRFIIANSAEST